MTIAMIMIAGSIRPFIMPLNNRIELFNEYYFLIINYHLICFTDMVDASAFGYVGFSLIVFICINMFVNIGIALGSSLLESIRRYNLKRKKQKNIT